jgi:fatty acid desaturase
VRNLIAAAITTIIAGLGGMALAALGLHSLAGPFIMAMIVWLGTRVWRRQHGKIHRPPTRSRWLDFGDL